MTYLTPTVVECLRCGLETETLPCPYCGWIHPRTSPPERGASALNAQPINPTLTFPILQPNRRNHQTN